MRNSAHMRNRRVLIVTAALVAFASLALVSSARTSTSVPTSTSVNIVNNSGRDIRHVFLSHVNADDWSDNQLGDAVITPGQSFTLNEVACDQNQVKVIGED